MLHRLFGPGDPFVIEDPRFGRLEARSGSLKRRGDGASYVEGPQIGRFESLGHDRWSTPSGEAEVLPNRAAWRRRQHDTRVRLGDRTWHLRQRTWFAATVERDGVELARLRERRSGGHGIDGWSGAPDALDGGIVHMLGLQRGVGAKGPISDAFDMPLLPVEYLRRRWETLA